MGPRTHLLQKSFACLAMYFALAYGLLIIGSEFNMFDEFVDAWFDAIEHWLWIEDRKSVV
jgi:hypothetical protein